MFLKQATSVVIQFGPIVDETDKVTPVSTLVSALDHASTGIKLSKNGAAFAVRHATVTASTYDTYGFYRVTLDYIDTGTIGRLRVAFNDPTTNVPITMDFFVLSARMYDALVGDYGPVTADYSDRPLAMLINGQISQVNEVVSVLNVQGGASPYLSTIFYPSVHPTTVETNFTGGAIDFSDSPTMECFAIQAVGDMDETGTLDGKIQESPDGGVWTDIPGAVFPQVDSANHTRVIRFTRTQPWLRSAGTVTGASVLFTMTQIIGDTTDILKANIKQVNDVDVGGDGSPGTPWSPA